MIAGFRRISAAFEKVVEILLLLALGLMTFIVLAGVFFRYVINRPLMFSFEGSTILFAWIVFIGIFLAYKDRLHLGVGIIDGHLSPGGRRALGIFRNAVILVISVYLVAQSWELTTRAGLIIPSLQISVRVFYVSMPIGFTLMAALALTRIVTSVFGIHDDDAAADDPRGEGADT